MSYWFDFYNKIVYYYDLWLEFYYNIGNRLLLFRNFVILLRGNDLS